MKNEIILYQSEELPERIEVRIDAKTVWLNLNQIAQLFNRDKSVISRHIRNIFKEEELTETATVAKNATVQIEAGREVKREIEYYNLDVIISVGYRVKSRQGVQSRIWATNVLRAYLLKGYALNQRMNRIENNMEHLSKKIDGISLQIQTVELPTQGVFFNGQVFDAYKLDLKKANEQYGKFELKTFTKSHDRFLIIDHSEVYHLGASLKDLGKKWFAFSKLNKNSVSTILKAIADA